jgi:hypothetical protein
VLWRACVRVEVSSMRSLSVASVLAVVLASPFSSLAAEQQPTPQQSKAQQAPSQRTKTPLTPEQQDAEARKKLEAEIAKELGQGGTKPAGAAQAQPAPTGPSPFARLLLLPDISAIGRAVAAYDSYDVGTLSPRPGPFGPKDRPDFQLQELELGIQAVVDPYVRADIFVAFTPEGTEVEEAFATTLGLPAGFQVRAGKILAPFGRLNQQHPDQWEFVDAPLAHARLLAEEALSGPGVDVGWLAPLPWFAELRVGAVNSGELPAAVAGEELGEESPRLTGIARLLQYFGLGETTTLGVGLSAARREEVGAGAVRDLGGVDVYLRYRPLATRAYVALQGELYALRFKGIPDVDDDVETGGWAQAVYRQSARFGYGVRYAWAPSEAPDVDGTERRWSALASYFPSEFQRVRLQVSYDRLPDGKDGVEALLHLEFGIGPHGAHPF